MHNDYSRERRRWDAMTAKIPGDSMSLWEGDYTPAGEVTPVLSYETTKKQRRCGMTGKQAAREEKRERRLRAVREELAVIEHEEHYGEEWGGI